MVIRKPKIVVTSMEQLDAYVEAEHGVVRGIYWENDVDSDTPYPGKFLRQTGEEVSEQTIVFKSSRFAGYTGNHLEVFERVVSLGMIANQGVEIFSRKKID